MDDRAEVMISLMLHLLSHSQKELLSAYDDFLAANDIGASRQVVQILSLGTDLLSAEGVDICWRILGKNVLYGISHEYGQRTLILPWFNPFTIDI